MIDIRNMIRENVRQLKPYSSARDEYSGPEGVFLDANESPYDNGINRYPDPYQRRLKDKISGIKDIPAEQIFLGNGSDEIIDLLLRVFCDPGKDAVIITPPTYGMYRVSAETNNIRVIEIPLNKDFQPSAKDILEETDAKILFLCSPNNPTGGLVTSSILQKILDNFRGLVVVDEAYIDFCSDHTLIPSLTRYNNLVIIQTLSKAWGMAGVRLGMGFSSEEIVDVLNKIKPPYNISTLTQNAALEGLNVDKKDERVQEILGQKKWLTQELKQIESVHHIFPSESNFLLVRFHNSSEVFNYLMDRQIIIRDRSNLPGCENCLRITVGLAEENQKLIQSLRKYEAN